MKKRHSAHLTSDLVLDTDGVVLDFLSAFERHSSEVLGRRISTSPRREHDLALRYGMSQHETELCWKSFDAAGLWRDLEPLPGAIRAVNALVDAGYSIHVVTGIPHELSEHRLFNFERYGFRPAGIRCVGSGTASKRAEISSISPTVFVDDRLEHIHENHEVPLLVWVDHGDEQPSSSGRGHDVRVSALSEWVDDFLSHPTAHFYIENRKEQQLKGATHASSKIHRF